MDKAGDPQIRKADVSEECLKIQFCEDHASGMQVRVSRLQIRVVGPSVGQSASLEHVSGSLGPEGPSSLDSPYTPVLDSFY